MTSRRVGTNIEFPLVRTDVPRTLSAYHIITRRSFLRNHTVFSECFLRVGRLSERGEKTTPEDSIKISLYFTGDKFVIDTSSRAHASGNNLIFNTARTNGSSGLSRTKPSVFDPSLYNTNVDDTRTHWTVFTKRFFRVTFFVVQTARTARFHYISSGFSTRAVNTSRRA